ncbi:MAG: hypothetical protein IFK92_08415 [Acidobacteria bacterium]|nr:hypothetical protein [Candidatus Sulfomarinibacter kjeldsenii]
MISGPAGSLADVGGEDLHVGAEHLRHHLHVGRGAGDHDAPGRIPICESFDDLPVLQLFGRKPDVGRSLEVILQPSIGLPGLLVKGDADKRHPLVRWRERGRNTEECARDDYLCRCAISPGLCSFGNHLKAG